MRRFTIAMAALTVALIVVLASGAPWVSAQSSELKSMMGDNFGKMQMILTKLIQANYEGLPETVKEIRDHAVQISSSPPDTVKTDANRRLFANYAYSLESQSENMMTVLKELIRHDKAASDSGMLNIDYLRVVAARHYGDMVTSCVLCHNQFRRKVVK